MINMVSLKNFGPLEQIEWPSLAKINLVIGSNGSGKTTLLKAMYCAVKTVETHKRGDSPKTDAEILSDKLFWTFQADKIGDLVFKGAESSLSYLMEFDKQKFSFTFGKDTTKQITVTKNTVPPRESNSIFFPAKEVLSLEKHIFKSREDEVSFGFDDTYLDLSRALRKATTKGKNFPEFAESRKNLELMLGGKVEFDEDSNKWYFIKSRQRFSIGMTSEGVKKIAILDTLLGNRYLNTNSIVFIDEPEAALHPAAISNFLDIICMLAESGIQFFMASHSYFVVKKLRLLAIERKLSIPVIFEQSGKWTADDLKKGMPDNSIINESIRLYKEEIGLALK
jgi:AAA15 family ATPase/GTPase